MEVTAAMIAAKHGHAAIFRALLEAGANPHQSIRTVAKSGNLEMLQMLADCGVNFDETDDVSRV